MIRPASGSPLSRREDRSAAAYRRRWSWDEVHWGSHCVDCYPGGCSYRVYVRGGSVYQEEVAGTFEQTAEGIPDFNPMGCNKGAVWSRQLVNEDRVTHPLKRVGERGSGQWERIEWEDAYLIWADAILDAVAQGGVDTVVHEGTPQKSTVMPTLRFMNTLGGTVVDLLGQTNDFNVGMHMTFGKFNLASSIDDWFLSDLALVWFLNPAFTRIPHAHYIYEARYRGAEIVQIAPDYNASAMHSDTFVPVEPGGDAAFALAMCQVIIEEGLLDAGFVAGQTDLPFAVRRDDGRFLRQSDLFDGGSDEVFFHLHPEGLREVSRMSLELTDPPRLTGSCETELADGTTVEVTTVFELLRSRLDSSYRPEAVRDRCGVEAGVIRDLARKIATRRTNILFGAAASKYYHGDLIERSLCLLLALTGNWGEHGTDIRAWNAGMLDGQVALTVKPFPGPEGSRIVLDVISAAADAAREEDPTLTAEEAARSTLSINPQMPPFLFWWNHCGFGDRWGRSDWGDPAMAREFEVYFEEARSSGWWAGLDRLPPDRPPRVLVDCGGNTLRRTRGGRKMMLEQLWPKLDLVVSIDHRMSATALHADLVLPAAQHYEKCDYHIPSPHTMNLVFSDRSQEPAGAARNEWDVYAGLLEVLARRAEARGMTSYVDGRGVERRFAELWSTFTLDGELCDQEVRANGTCQ